VTERRCLTHVVVDTDVASWLLGARPIAARLRRLDASSATVRESCRFVTVTELRYGARRAGWAEIRRRQLEHSVGVRRRLLYVRQWHTGVAHEQRRALRDGSSRSSFRWGAP